MTLQQGLHLGALARGRRVKLCHDLAPAHDCEVLTPVLDCV
jgi:hypothetical protein